MVTSESEKDEILNEWIADEDDRQWTDRHKRRTGNAPGVPRLSDSEPDHLL